MITTTSLPHTQLTTFACHSLLHQTFEPVGLTCSPEDVVDFAERYISVKEAAVLLGNSELTVQSWVRARIIRAASGPGIDGCHGYRFEKARLLEWRHERMSYQEASQWLGRSKATLHRWIRQGKLTPLPDSRGKPHWFARSAVMQMAPVHTAVFS